VSIAAEIEQFIVTEIAPGRGIESIAPERNLLAEGLVDSLGIVELIAFLEGKYAIKIGDDDIDPENFGSIDSIVSFVQSKEARS
jgi:acyl carrier protein